MDAIFTAELFESSPDALLRFGITRVGDLTGLDTIGIPVWFASRPNSRGLSVSQGKGLDETQARLSAIMEAVEGAVAENPRDLVTEFGSYQEVVARGLKPVPIETMSRCAFEAFDPARERAWVKGRSFVTGESVLAPFELIGLDMRSEFPWDRQSFRMSSQGLAAGFEFWPTALHALQELAESDATAPLALLGRSSGVAQAIEFAAYGHRLKMAVDKVRAAGLEPRFLSVNALIDVPVVGAVIDWPVVGSSGPTTLSCAGFACRMDLEDAALAALLEAVQSRLTEISGARDDLSPGRFYPRSSAGFHPTEGGRRVKQVIRKIAAQSYQSAESQFKWLAERILASGSQDIYLFPLGGNWHDLHVVRVLVDKLQAATDSAASISARGIEAICAGAR